MGDTIVEDDNREGRYRHGDISEDEVEKDQEDECGALE
jgi:hypothetical protein